MTPPPGPKNKMSTYLVGNLPRVFLSFGVLVSVPDPPPNQNGSPCRGAAAGTRKALESIGLGFQGLVAHVKGDS